jgi:UDP-2,4-diacetamido-2,4,6-trideoxy-beta-L-altropyranose hydrolase
VKIVFRCDASLVMGTGHVMRCLTLADALTLRGAECEFMCLDHRGNMISHIESLGYRVYTLPSASLNAGDVSNTDDIINTGKVSSAPVDELAHSHWLGCSQAQDAEQCLQAIAGQTFDWLVVDHYALDYTWEVRFHSQVKHTMVIDDLADRRHQCDVLFDQNYYGDTAAERYLENDLVDEKTTLLLGPEYALIRPEYREFREKLASKKETLEKTNEHTDRIQRVLVFLGGSDPDDVTGKVVAGLCRDEFASVSFDVVVGVNYARKYELAANTENWSNIYIHCGLPSLAGVMSECDLMIGAGGSTSWERMCLGLPAVVTCIAENQREYTYALARDEFVMLLPDAKELLPDQVTDALLSCMKNITKLKVMSLKGMSLVSGLGLESVCDCLFDRKNCEEKSLRHL